MFIWLHFSGVRFQPSDDDDDEESEEDIAADDESDDPDWNHSDAESTDSDSDPSDSDYEEYVTFYKCKLRKWTNVNRFMTQISMIHTMVEA